ncbi:MAG TPA: peptidoglycan-binding protein [Candidatus Paceibacterota bacterium]|nr:peptidoglycan-binding protein [Candidatus Paceibacterota bacterium]
MKRIIAISAAIFLTGVPIISYAEVGADTAADAQCIPITTTKCGCGLVFNEKTGSCEKGENKYQCICSQSDAGVVTTGICQADSICHAISTGGKTPEKPTQQQLQQGAGAGQPGSQPEVSPNGKTATPGTDQSSIPTNPTAGPTSLPAPGQSLFQDALQQLQQMAGGNGSQSGGSGGDTSQPSSQTGVPLWLSSGQAQLTPPETQSSPGSSPSNTYSDFPTSDGNFNSGNIASQGLGLGPSSDVAKAVASDYLSSTYDQFMTDMGKVVDQTLQTASQAEDFISNGGANASITGPQINPDGTIDPVSFYQTALQKFQDSSLNGVTPDWGKQFGIDGSPESWARFVTQLCQQESSCSVANVNTDGSLQRFASTLPNEQSYGPLQFNKGEYGLQTWADVNNPSRNIDAFIQVAEQGKVEDYFGSVQRPNEITQQNGWFNANVAPYVNSAPVPSTPNYTPSVAGGNPWSASDSGFNPSSYGANWWQAAANGYAGVTPQIYASNTTGEASSGGNIPVENGPAYPSGTVTSEPLPLSDQQVAAQIASQIPLPEQVQTNPQQDILATVAQENAASENAILQDRLALADAQTQAFDNPVMPPVNTDLPSGQALTQQIYDNAIAGADQNIPTPTQADTNIPSQAEMQASLLADQGKSLSALDANQFYYNVQGNQTAESGPAAPAGSLEQGPALEQPNPAGVVTSSPLPPSEQQIASQIPTPEQVQTNPQQSIEATNQQEAQFAAQVENTTLSARLAQADSETAAYQQALLDAPSKIPTPEMVSQSGEQLTQQIAQEAGAPPAQTSADQTLADVTNADRTFVAYAGAETTLPDGTHIGSDLLSPSALSTGAGTELTSQFAQESGDATLSPNPPLPESRPASAGSTGIDLAGCGGVCEFNNTGGDVKAIQQFLNEQGYNVKNDGVYGSQTQAAVEAFQKGNGLQVDGIVGPQTVAKMNDVAASEGQIGVVQSGEQVTAQVQQAAAQQQESDILSTAPPVSSQPTAPAETQTQSQSNAASSNQSESAAANDQSAAPEKTYTLSNAGDLRGDFLANPVTAALIPDSMKQELIAAHETNADSVTFTQSQLDSIKWGLMSGAQATGLQNVLSQAGYQVPSNVTLSDRQPGVQDIANLQFIAQQNAGSQIQQNVNFFKGCWTGICF